MSSCQFCAVALLIRNDLSKIRMSIARHLAADKPDDSLLWFRKSCYGH